MLPEVGAAVSTNLTGNLCRKMSPIPRHVTDQHLEEQSARNLEHMHIPTKATADLHRPMITRGGCWCGLMNPSGGTESPRAAPLQPAGLHREARLLWNSARACVVQNSAKVTLLPQLCPAPG